MFSRKSLPVGTLFMVLVIMLALLGVGYALWSDTLVIEGEVHTGEVDMAFSPCETNDPGTTFDPGYEKHVASCECALSTGSIEDDYDDGNDQLDITITDGYPSYSCNVTYDMTNIGSVPVHLFSVLEDYDPGVLDVEQSCVDEQIAEVGIGYQLHPGDSVDCQIDLHVRQEAPENDILTIHKEYLWGQYNECLPSVVETGEPYENPLFGTVTRVTVTTLDCSTYEDAIKVEASQSYQQGQPQGEPAGWAGISCIEPGYSQVIGGGVTDGAAYAEGPAEFGAPAIDGYNYPEYPHWCFNSGVPSCGGTPDLYNIPNGEEGWVVEAAGDPPPTAIYALCAP